MSQGFSWTKRTEETSGPVATQVAQCSNRYGETERTRCTLPAGHDGAHKGRTGEEWKCLDSMACRPSVQDPTQPPGPLFDFLASWFADAPRGDNPNGCIYIKGAYDLVELERAINQFIADQEPSLPAPFAFQVGALVRRRGDPSGYAAWKVIEQRNGSWVLLASPLLGDIPMCKSVRLDEVTLWEPAC